VQTLSIDTGSSLKICPNLEFSVLFSTHKSVGWIRGTPQRKWWPAGRLFWPWLMEWLHRKVGVSTSVVFPLTVAD